MMMDLTSASRPAGSSRRGARLLLDHLRTSRVVPSRSWRRYRLEIVRTEISPSNVPLEKKTWSSTTVKIIDMAVLSFAALTRFFASPPSTGTDQIPGSS